MGECDPPVGVEREMARRRELPEACPDLVLVDFQRLGEGRDLGRPAGRGERRVDGEVDVFGVERHSAILARLHDKRLADTIGILK